jgi:hypothetical protein
VVSVDAYSLQIAAFKNKGLASHIDIAGKEGLGESNVSKLKVKKIA